MKEQSASIPGSGAEDLEAALIEGEPVDRDAGREVPSHGKRPGRNGSEAPQNGASEGRAGKREPWLKIGPISERLGLTPRTLRYWEERGLLPPARRTPGGTRLYGDEHEHCARGIQRLKRAGLQLDEIVELQRALGNSGTALAGITNVRERLARREEDLRESIREQQALLAELEAAQKCAALCDGCHGKVYDNECIECLHHESGQALPDALRSVMEAATRLPKEGA